jgi:hypothetical protein
VICPSGRFVESAQQFSLNRSQSVGRINDPPLLPLRWRITPWGSNPPYELRALIGRFSVAKALWCHQRDAWRAAYAKYAAAADEIADIIATTTDKSM